LLWRRSLQSISICSGQAKADLRMLAQSCLSLAGGVILMYIYQLRMKAANPLLSRFLLLPFILYTLACWAMDLFAFLAQATLGLEVCFLYHFDGS
jgi:hypothetical protein